MMLAPGVQRFEVFTAAGKRRDWASEVEAAIIAESYSRMETVCAAGRRHRLCSSHLFTRAQVACLPPAVLEKLGAAAAPAVSIKDMIKATELPWSEQHAAVFGT